MVFGREDRYGTTIWSSGNILLAAAVFFLALAAYAGTLNHELVWDDKGVLEHIGSITETGGLKAVLTSPFATHVEEGYVSGFYRPVPMASLWLDTMYVTLIPFQYHLVNVLLHGINALLVFLVIRVIATSHAAFTGSAIFAVHPVHSESVSFVSGRTDLWATVFILLSVFLWLRVRNDRAESVTFERLVSIGAFLMACLSKEVAYVMPVVLLVWDAVSPTALREERPAWWTRNRSWIYGWLAVLSFVAVMRFVVFGPAWGLTQAGGAQIYLTHGFSGLVLSVQAFLMYLRLLILPWPLKVFYSPHELVLTMTTFLAVLAILFLFVFAYRRGRKDVPVSMAVWITVFLLPVLAMGFRDGAPLAERFLYLPSVGFCLLAGSLTDICPGRRRLLMSGLGVVIALMFLGTGIQNRVWRDDISLFTEFVRVSPLEEGGYYNLGNALSEKGRDLGAVAAYRRSLEIDPKNYRAYFNMGNSLRKLERTGEAADAFREALRREPAFVAAHVNLGSVYMETKEYHQAIEVYREGLRYDPSDLTLNVGLVLAYLEAHDRPAAEQYYRFLKGKYPDLAHLIGNLIAGHADGN